MNANKLWIPRWKHVVLVVLITIGVIWGGLKWAEKAYARIDFKTVECDGQYEYHYYTAFSPLGIFPFEDSPIFVRLVEKKTGRVIGETGVYWTTSAPPVLCPNFSTPDEISVIFAGNIGVTHTFKVSPP